jgi:NADH-quinone oxidoreductase subunit A
MTPTAIVAYLALFASVGFLFVLASLLLGRLLRAHAPTAQKVETYECGEPAVGPGSVQFDLRFYVVALLFIIFEVEVAFFFPPATIFGKAAHVLARAGDVQQGTTCTDPLACGAEDGVMAPSTARTLALASMLDLGVFFAVLLVGFAYVWRLGDLDWVRAVGHPRSAIDRAALALESQPDGPQ